MIFHIFSIPFLPSGVFCTNNAQDLTGITLGENSDKALTDTSKFVFGLTFRPLIGASLSEPHSYVLTWTLVIGDIYIYI